MSKRTASGFHKLPPAVPVYQGPRYPLHKAKFYKSPAALIKARNANLPEKKGVETPISSVGNIVATTGTNADSFVLNLIQAGNGSWNRVGRKVHLKSVRLFGVAGCTYTANAGLGVGFLRMVVVWDKQPSGGAIPAWDQIFGNTDQSGTETSSVMSRPRYDNMDRFQVLRDVELLPQALFDGVTAADLRSVYFPFDEYIKLGNKEVVFSGQSTPMTIADISTGALYVYYRAPVVSATSNWTVTNAFARLRYSD